jgi:hypothetical protein
LRRISARAPTPTMGLLSVLTWSPRDRISTLILRSASPTSNKLLSQINDRKVNLTVRGMFRGRIWASEITIQEHVQRRHRNPLTTIECLTSSRFLVTPEVSSTGIKKHRDKEKIHQSACLFSGITVLIPFGEKVGYAGNPADFEMLPTAMGRNEVVFIRTEVALLKKLACCACELHCKSPVISCPYLD